MSLTCPYYQTPRYLIDLDVTFAVSTQLVHEPYYDTFFSRLKVHHLDVAQPGAEFSLYL